MTGGETPHQGIEGGLARSINLVAAGLVVADAALTGRHDGDGARRRHEFLERLDNSHRAQGVCHHHADELFGRDVGDGFPVVVRHARIDEQQVKSL